VWIDGIVRAPAPARVRAYRVAFEPGARTAWIPPGEEHRHGAAPDAAMVRLAIHEAGEDGTETAWLEQVTDADHRAAAAAGAG
jgi:quercetin dioxygenase-like cupin family protein